jgi:putative NIF3 family GTP cyclohydrolase 1 type 2
MQTILPQAYRRIGYDYTRSFEADFCERFNGLMLRSGDVVEKVYCACFPTPEVLENLLAASSGDALLFLHHPVDMEVLGRGFLPISPDVLERLKARGVSVYACHAPMDCHEEIGTAASIVQAFDLQVEKRFLPYGNGFAGRIGSIAPIGLDELIEKGRRIFGVDRVEVGGAKPKVITRISVVPGGGNDPELMAEAEGAGVQAYIGGTWTMMTTPLDEGVRAWAESNRAACLAYAEKTRMALLGFSHAATEFLVMKTQMADYFQQKGLPVECLEQSDWWR